MSTGKDVGTAFNCKLDVYMKHYYSAILKIYINYR